MSGMLSNRMYLYVKDLDMLTKHQLLVSMYNNHSGSSPVRVARQKSKLRAFHYKVTYVPGVPTQADYGSGHHPCPRHHSFQ